MRITTNTLVGEIVKINYKTAAIFQENKIDFCCGGNKTVSEACNKAGVDSKEFISQLRTALQDSDPDAEYIDSLDLSTLSEYIVNRHHAYVRKNIPVLKQYIEKIADVHGSAHPELYKVKEEFDKTSGELIMHMQKEELLLFPYIKKMEKHKKENTELAAPHFGTVSDQIQKMIDEHEDEGERFSVISELTDNYTVPSDGCTTYEITFRQLADFEKDLYRHIHLENNILFPKALILEKEIKQTA